MRVFIVIMLFHFISCQQTVFNVTLCTGGSQFVTLNVNSSKVWFPNVDFYVAPSTNYGSTKYMYRYYLPSGSNYLKPALDAMLTLNNNTHFAAGTYSTKRNIGWPNDRDFQHAVNMSNSTSAVMDAITPVFGDPNNPYVLDVEAVYQSSFLDALVTVAKLHQEFNIRHHARRVFFTITDLPFAQQGDVWPNMHSPDSHFPVAFDSESNIITSFPPNNLDGILKWDCTLFGMVCSELWGLQRMLGGHIACNKPLQYGYINITNTTQFAPGSCEDFPTAAQAAAVAQEFSFDVWALMQYDPFTSNGVDPQTEILFEEFVESVSPFSYVIPPNANLTEVLPQLMLLYWFAETEVLVGGTSLGEITSDPCNTTTHNCTVIIDVVYGDDQNQTLVIYVEGIGNVTINVGKCAGPPPTESRSSSESHPPVHPAGHGDGGTLMVVVIVVLSIVLLVVIIGLIIFAISERNSSPPDRNVNSQAYPYGYQRIKTT
jgi:hypothetical protein